MMFPHPSLYIKYISNMPYLTPKYFLIQRANVKTAEVSTGSLLCLSIYFRLTGTNTEAQLACRNRAITFLLWSNSYSGCDEKYN